jgi:hypothetical protein
MRKVLSEILKRAQWSKNKIPNNIQKVFSKDNACYVLITCGQPSEDGKMQVEMTYEGDATLAAYLIESAQGLIEDSDEVS